MNDFGSEAKTGSRYLCHLQSFLERRSPRHSLKA